MISTDLVDLSRLQFALTAMYHFIFVPLTLGLSFLLVVMEVTYVLTGKQMYKDMTRFWGKLFGINFALGVATGITMEFQFGTNWAYYSHYVGDIFGAPLAIEGLMAFFLESTFIGLFFFGWDRLSKGKHLFATIMMALGSNLSALWILVANGWMMYPTGAEFNFETMRMEMTNFWAVFTSEWAQAKFVHTVAGGYMTGAMFVMAVSAYYLLKRQDTHEAPAPLTLFAIPNEAEQKNAMEISIPWVFGLMGTRSLSTEIPGIKQLEAQAEERIKNGQKAVATLEALRKDPKNEALRAEFQALQPDLGFGLLLKRYTEDVTQATPEMIKQAAQDTTPQVAPMFWSFRLMISCGLGMALIFVLGLVFSMKKTLQNQPLYLRLTLLALPLPWIACEAGWFVAEYGRQPWTIYNILPTHLSVSSLSTGDLIGSILGFVILYTLMLIAEMWLMIRFSRKGPSSLGTGRYHFEQK